MKGTADRRMAIADHETEMPPRMASFLLGLLLLGRRCSATPQDPPRLTIIHFDVNEADATLLISPAGRGVLIDAGGQGTGHPPILEFLTR